MTIRYLSHDDGSSLRARIRRLVGRGRRQPSQRWQPSPEWLALMRDDGVWAITRSGRIYVGRGRWNGQKPSQKGTFLADLVVGVGELAVGDISQLADPEVLA